MIEEAKCSERNLIWRAIAFNQDDARHELDEGLSKINSTKNKNFTEASLTAAGDCTKYFAKLAQLVSKALSLHNAMQKPNAIRPHTGGQEKILLTIGGLFMRPFLKRGADTLAGWLMQSLILVRTGANYGKVIGLLFAEAKFSKFDRADTLLLMTIGNGIAKAEESASRTMLIKKWADLVIDSDIAKPPTDERLPGGFNESREMRFAIVATLMQIIYFSKIYHELDENPKNDKLRAEVWAAGMALGSGLAEICAVGVKFVNSLGDAALTYQGLKFGGGLLSISAAWINFQNDLTTGRQRKTEGDRDIVWIYYIKAGADGAVGFFSGLNSLSYTRPAFEMAARKFPESVMGRAAASVVRKTAAMLGKLVLRRAILIFGGIECTLAMFAIDLLVWRFKDDELQVWCKRCAFGKVKSSRILSAAIQKISFDDALKDVI